MATRILMGAAFTIGVIFAQSPVAHAQAAPPAPPAQPPAAAPAQPQPFAAGTPLGVTVNNVTTPMSSNAKVYGGIVNGEACVYDEARGLIIVPSRGAPQDQNPNDGWFSLFNHDGSVHTAKWIGVNRNGLTLNQPQGTDIANGVIYTADRDGGLRDPDPTKPATPQVSVIRKFDLKTGAPMGEVKNPQSTGLNDIAVAPDGTIYGTQSTATDPKIFKITAAGVVTELAKGMPLMSPNGIAIDNDGNLVIVQSTDDVLVMSPADGKILRTFKTGQPGNDGIVVMKDGTIYVSSVQQGGISRIRPGQPPQLIATGIPNAASMCYDSAANQLVIPMNQNNAIAIVKLQ
jgi:sugar lactone lactonase YvrE